MTRPESVFLVSWLWDGDTPARNIFLWTLQEALETVAILHDRASVSVQEVHPTKGTRTVLQYAPDGLITAQHYETHEQRWKPGYSEDFVQELLAQYPKLIQPRWRDGVQTA